MLKASFLYARTHVHVYIYISRRHIYHLILGCDTFDKNLRWSSFSYVRCVGKAWYDGFLRFGPVKFQLSR